MNAIDLGVLLVVLVLALRGHRRGFLREVFTFAGWLGGAAGAFWLMVDLAPLAAEALHVPAAVGGAIAFTGVFLGIFLACSLAGWLISKIVRATFFAPLDRFAGLSLGAAEAITLSALLLFVLHASPLFPAVASRIESSRIGKPLAVRAEAFITALRKTGAAESPAAEKSAEEPPARPQRAQPRPPTADRSP